MGRRCKCRYTNEYGTVSTFFKVVNNKGKNEYYKNEEIYKTMLAERKSREELLQYISINILNYDGSMFLPPSFLARIKNLNKTYPYEVILQTFKDNEDTLLYWMNQDNKFRDESNRLNYLMAIIQNKINDTYLKWKVQERRNKEDNTPNVELGLLDVNIKQTNKTNNGIGDFL